MGENSNNNKYRINILEQKVLIFLNKQQLLVTTIRTLTNTKLTTATLMILK